MRQRRRKILKSLGTLGITGLAGCTTLSSGDQETDTPSKATSMSPPQETPTLTPTETLTSTPTETPSETPLPDPPSSQASKLAAVDGDSGDRFGYSVAVSGDGTTAIVGSLYDEDPNGDYSGSAYVFSLEDGSWTQDTKLVPDDGDKNDRFGWSVAVSGDGMTAIIGAAWDEDPNGENAGSAYVFSQGEGSWTQDAKLVPKDGNARDLFGGSMAVSDDGTTAIIGAPQDEKPNGDSAGSAYVFSRTGESWSQDTKLTPDDGGSGDEFGKSVAVSDDGMTTVIGALFAKNQSGGLPTGSAYVFSRTGGSWTQDTKLTPEDIDWGDRFGQSVAVSGSGTTTIIGAPEDKEPNGDSSGSAYVFSRASGSWSQDAKLAPQDGDSGDLFGYSVAVSDSGTTPVVGALHDEERGSAYVFSRTGGSWTEAAKLNPDGGQSSTMFGRSLAVSDAGDTIIVGADGETEPNGLTAGSAYLFE